jgi:hypothetical protein
MRLTLMWTRIRSFFSVIAIAGSKPQLGFDVIKSEVEAVLQLDLKTDASRTSNAESVSSILRHLDEEIENVRQQAAGYPDNPISALVWMNGTGYGNLACAFTHHFRKAGWLEREETASALWVKATLAICSHYHHLVGPAMLANAACHDRLGNIEWSTQLYGGIVKDFAFIVADYLSQIDAPSAEDRAAIASLKAAADKLLSRDVKDGIDLETLRSHATTVLGRFGAA